ncbi:MAG: hypothetical protein HY432_00210 [Candidatus Liptonbacteria bacterium]|nr:hypothetical protein [Candidatus Liptonbacteria bacterium]
MKTLRFVPIFAAVLLGTGCGVGEILGPPTNVVSVAVSKVGMPGDVLIVQINGIEYAPQLTDTNPVQWYRADIQTDRYRGYRLYEKGKVFVQVWSENFGCLSREQEREGRTDRLITFEFRTSSFPSECRRR